MPSEEMYLGLECNQSGTQSWLVYLTPVSHSESVVPVSAASVSPGNLLEMQILRPHQTY